MSRPRVSPYLTVSPAAAAIAFYTGAFFARQKAYMPALDGLRVAHCELEINGGSVMLADFFPNSAKRVCRFQEILQRCRSVLNMTARLKLMKSAHALLSLAQRLKRSQRILSGARVMHR